MTDQWCSTECCSDTSARLFQNSCGRHALARGCRIGGTGFGCHRHSWRCRSSRHPKYPTARALHTKWLYKDCCDLWLPGVGAGLTQQSARWWALGWSAWQLSWPHARPDWQCESRSQSPSPAAQGELLLQKFQSELEPVPTELNPFTSLQFWFGILMLCTLLGFDAAVPRAGGGGQEIPAVVVTAHQVAVAVCVRVAVALAQAAGRRAAAQTPVPVPGPGLHTTHLTTAKQSHHSHPWVRVPQNSPFLQYPLLLLLLASLGLLLHPVGGDHQEGGQQQSRPMHYGPV